MSETGGDKDSPFDRRPIVDRVVSWCIVVGGSLTIATGLVLLALYLEKTQTQKGEQVRVEQELRERLATRSQIEDHQAHPSAGVKLRQERQPQAGQAQTDEPR